MDGEPLTDRELPHFLKPTRRETGRADARFVQEVFVTLRLPGNLGQFVGGVLLDCESAFCATEFDCFHWTFGELKSQPPDGAISSHNASCHIQFRNHFCHGPDNRKTSIRFERHESTLESRCPLASQKAGFRTAKARKGKRKQKSAK